MITEHGLRDWTALLSAMQISLNNSPNKATGRTPGEIIYCFKLREGLDLVSDGVGLTDIVKLRRIHRKEAEESIVWASMKAKRHYDQQHQGGDLKPRTKVFLRLHHGYTLPGVGNKKFSNQRAGPLMVKEKVSGLAYQPDRPLNWKIHPVVLVA